MCLSVTTVEAKELRLNKNKVQMTVGEKVTLKVKGAKKKKITWKSSKTKVARVTKKGIVIAKTAGQTVVRAKVGAKTLKCKVTVTDKKSDVPNNAPQTPSGTTTPGGTTTSGETTTPEGTTIPGETANTGGTANTGESTTPRETTTPDGTTTSTETPGDNTSEKEDVEPYTPVGEVTNPPVPGKKDDPVEPPVQEEKEYEMGMNHYTEVMDAEVLDTTENSSRSLAEYEGITTLTNDVTSNKPNVAGERDFSGLQNFSWKLFSQVQKEATEENVVISPTSAYIALAMAGQGAEGNTQAEFSKILGLSPEMLKKKTKVGALKQHLMANKGETTLNLANSIWMDPDATFNPEYVQGVVDYFDSEIYAGDLPTDQTKNAINQWRRIKPMV